jgi:hypothetical protein
MQLSFQDLFPNVGVTPARAAAFGAAIGGMAALAGFSLLGDALADAIAPMPVTALVVIAEVAGAAIAWKTHRNGRV